MSNGSTDKNQMILIALLIASFVLMLIFIITNQYNECSTEDCFVEYANDCRNAVYKNDIIGIGFSYSIDDSCVLKKKVAYVDVEELSYLKGQEMKCIFKKNTFDERLLHDFIAGTSDCGGKLKDSLLIIYNDS